jgi:hypothetical protein
MLAVGLWARYSRRFGERINYVVPAGVIVGNRGRRGRQGQAIYVRRSDTPLVWDGAYAWVRVGGVAHQIAFGWPHLIAWVASAPSPSVEAVQALLGDNVELTVAR